MTTIAFDQLPTMAMDAQRVLCDVDDFSGIYRQGGSLADFLCSLPVAGAGSDLMRLRDAIIAARRGDHGVLLACGGALVERGLTPIVTQCLVQHRLSGLAMTGNAMVKDVEVALAGKVFASDPEQGVARESGALITEAIDWAAEEGLGLGESIGRKLLDGGAPHREHSMLATAAEARIPLTVHPAIGADAYNRFPHLNGEAFGAAAVRDFRKFTNMVAGCERGVVLNVASAVVMPRLLAEAITAIRSSGIALQKMTTCTLTSSNIADAGAVIRGALDGKGDAFTLDGAIELVLPLLVAAVIDGGD